MAELSNDPVMNIIYAGIKEGVRVTVENKCFGSAIILVYSGIDAMAYLNMPEHQERVIGKNFIEWVDSYMIFPRGACISGIDLYGARCGMVHTYSSFSDLSERGDCKVIGYVDKNIPEISYNPEHSDTLLTDLHIV